ncbi:MAG: AN1-type zinc finger domain-containing protein [Candidatus Caldarchaeum sp.]
MTRCLVCGVDELLPFRCRYCGGDYCAEHRLPEKHGCSGVMFARNPDEIRVKETRFYGMQHGVGRGRWGWMSAEPIHLTVATAAVCLAGLGFMGWPVSQGIMSWLVLVGFAVSFVGHELAHKLTAVRKGLWARFSLFPAGLLATVLTAVLPIPFTVIMPGAVSIYGRQTVRDYGEIALAGPLFNIALAFTLALAGRSTFFWVLNAVASVNAFLAFFNLLPIPPLDGEKIFSWSRFVWALVFAASLAMLIVIRL